MSKKLIRVGHSPDPDDAFMFYAVRHGKIPLGPYEWQDVVLDIQTLNEMARHAELEVTAMSVHAYAHTAAHYAIMPCGASIGDNYGPVLIARTPLAPDDLKKAVVAVPGELTTAFLALKIYKPQVRHIVMPFDEILPAVKAGKVDVGLIIHEGQLTYKTEGLHLICDLGEWWYEDTGLPLPLGIDCIRKDLTAADQVAVAMILKNSILHALDHRKEALDYALGFGRGLDPERADTFVGMYVNDLTVDCGESVRKGIQELLSRGLKTGLYPSLPSIDFIDLPNAVTAS